MYLSLYNKKNFNKKRFHRPNLVEMWRRTVCQAQKVEEVMGQFEGLIEEESNPLVITIGHSKLLACPPLTR